MASQELVSIIMPTYKCGRFIAESIKSVQAQTYKNWELIIVDDCAGEGGLNHLPCRQSKDHFRS